MITWWNDSSIEIEKINGRYIALYGWNGEKFTDCWEVEEVVNNIAYGVKEDNIKVKPIYSETLDEQCDILEYEFNCD